jgi:hypothetical protein
MVQVTVPASGVGETDAVKTAACPLVGDDGFAVTVVRVAVAT